MLLGQIALVLALQIEALGDGVLEGLFRGGNDVHGLGVGQPHEGLGQKRPEDVRQGRVHVFGEQAEILGAILHDGAHGVFEHRLGQLHVVFEVGKGHLRLDHPELGGMARGVGMLGPKGGTEGVDLAQGAGQHLGRKLSGHGQVGVLAEKVLSGPFGRRQGGPGGIEGR